MERGAEEDNHSGDSDDSSVIVVAEDKTSSASSGGGGGLKKPLPGSAPSGGGGGPKKARTTPPHRWSMFPPRQRPESSALTAAESAAPYSGINWATFRQTDCRFLPGTLRCQITPSIDSFYKAAPNPAAAASSSSSSSSSSSAASAAPPAAPALPKGVVLLRGFLDHARKRELIEAVDAMTAQRAFHIPAVNVAISGSTTPQQPESGWANMYYLSLGKEWVGTGASKSYTEGALPIPSSVLALAQGACRRAEELHPHLFPHTPTALQWADPREFVGLFNYYPPGWGCISAHSDSSEKSLAEGKTYPVISFSLGDSAKFTLWPQPEEKVEVILACGDALLFGGPARGIRHEVGKPMKGSRLGTLGMVAGRLNVTIRKL
jgi:alkylated DNA repair dioxygenase AlkB